MAYSELVKNFKKVRSYMRDFYVYGFKSREEFDRKSARSYDDERRRIESWLGDYMSFERGADGKSVFISIDSRTTPHNPLFSAWKSKSFTDGDITLHFILFDIFHSPDVFLTLNEITAKIADDYLSYFENAKTYDDSTVRKKLKEYVGEGILVSEKQGRAVKYRRAKDIDISGLFDTLCFFSEVMPCGAVGSFLLDKGAAGKSLFSFKHHYITGTMDSGVMCGLFEAMREGREVFADYQSRRNTEPRKIRAVPLKIFLSAQNGRQYLMAWSLRFKRIIAYRLDCLSNVQAGEVNPRFDALRGKLNRMQRHMWGVNCNRLELDTEHVEFTVRFEKDEVYILHRLEREKRCGTVELLDACTAKFSADVYDSTELVPWIRTFLCRIESLSFSNKEVEARFLADLSDMYAMYEVGGEGE